MPGFLDDAADNGLLGGLVGFGGGFMKGMQDAEDRKYKRMEFEAKAKANDLELQKNDFNKRLEARKAGFLVPGRGEEFDPGDLKYDPQYLDLKTKEAAAMGGKMLPADTALKVQQGANVPRQLDDIEATLTNSADMFSPVKGRLSSMNPYDTKAQTIDAQLRAAAQDFGRFMEGGVLRKEDEEKYRRMFPSLGDTPDVAKNKLAIVRRLLVEKQNADVKALGAQGYRTKGFSPLKTAPVPGLLKGNATNGSEDQQAIEWAKQNPKDPRAAEILRANGL